MAEEVREIPWADYSVVKQLASTRPYEAMVRVIGKIVRRNPSSIVLETSDQNQVIVHTNTNFQTLYAGVLAKVLADSSLEEQSFFPVEDNFGLLVSPLISSRYGCNESGDFFLKEISNSFSRQPIKKPSLQRKIFIYKLSSPLSEDKSEIDLCRGSDSAAN